MYNTVSRRCFKGSLSRDFALVLAACLVLAFVPALVMFGAPSASAFSGSGSGTAGDPYIITTVEQLQEIKDDLTAYYVLGNDIDAFATSNWNDNLDGGYYGFEPIGTDEFTQFTGSFDGRGYKISDLYINRPDNENVGLFGYVGSGGVVKNVGLEDVNVSGFYYVGGLVGLNEGTVSNSYSTGSVSGNYAVIGGLVGLNYDGTVSNCYSTASISGGSHYIGGIAGFNTGTVSNSYSTGSVSCSYSYAGGIVGYNNSSGSVFNCYSTGSVSGVYYVGGLVGWNEGIVIDSYSTGSASGEEAAGGLVGYNEGTISSSYSTGSVDSNNSAGGLIGRNSGIGSVSDSYSRGSVSGSWAAGGLVGGNWGDISNSYSTGPVSGVYYVGGLVGYGDAGTVSNSFWDTDTSGQTTSAGGTGKTTAEMKTESTFTDAEWDFVDIWDIDAAVNDGYPFLTDTSSPTGTVIVDTDPIYTGDLVQVVTVIYDEDMDPLSPPTITFSAGNFTTRDDGAWGGTNRIWTETFDHNAAAEEILGVTVSSAGATDVAGNPEGASVPATFDIDTVVPTVVSVTPSDPMISDFDVGGQFAVTIYYDEPMDPASTPTVTFDLNVVFSGTLALNAGLSGWLDVDEYVVVYDVMDVNETKYDVDISVTGAKDVAGNTQNDGDLVDAFDVDTENPLAPDLVSPADESFTNDSTPDFDWSDVAAVNYDLLVDDDPLFGSPEIDEDYLGVSAYTPAGALADDTYSWKVRSRDDVGNVSDYSSVCTFTIDTNVPIGTVTVDTNPIYTGDFVQVVTVTYDKDMDPLSTPTLTFSVGIFTSGGDGEWYAPGKIGTKRIWIETFVHNEAAEEIPGATVSSAGATDVVGNPEGASVLGTFDIDTVAPTVVLVTPLDIQITDSDVGIGSFIVTIDYDEPMDLFSTPTVTFTSDVVTSGTLALNAGLSGWFDANTYRPVYDVADVNETQSDVDISVTGAMDVAGNTQNDGGLADAFDVDTENPTPTISVDTNTICDGDRVQEVTVTCDEDMNTGGSAPNISFSWTSGSWSSLGGLWTSSTTWEENFEITDANEKNTATVTINGGATDIVGNEAGSDSTDFAVDTENPSIDGNDELAAAANGGGSGTPEDPYIIENFVIGASSADGITIQNTTAYFIIRNCLVENGGGSYFGIYLDSVINGKVENNICSNNDGTGICVNSSSNNILDSNTCNNNSGTGIYLEDESDGNTVSNNTCSNNYYGIYLDDSFSDVDNNICGNNVSYGIYVVEYSSNTISNNTCENNGDGGIYVDSTSDTTISNNTCSNNEYGIYIVGSSNSVLSLNYLLNNTTNNAYDDGTNSWNNDGNGNYWSDWQPPAHPDADDDGIVDEPRPIDGGGNEDTYPRVLNWSLAVPTLVSPADGSFTNDSTPYFDWSDVAGAVSYDLLVDDDPNFGSPEIVNVGVSDYTPLVGLADGTYSWKVQALDVVGNPSGYSAVWQFTVQIATVSPPPPPPPPPPSPPPPQSVEIPTITPEASASVDVNNSTVTSLDISVLNDVNNVGITVQEFFDRPTEISIAASGTIYRYLEIIETNITNNDISSVTMTFKVEKSWIALTGIDVNTITMNRYNPETGEWASMPTTKIGEDDTYVYFSATLPGLSYLAVSGLINVPAPATFTMSALTINPSQVSVGQGVSISVMVRNTGDLVGTYMVILRIGGTVADIQNVVINGGLERLVTFTVTKSVAGTYSVDVDGLAGSFSVVAPTVIPLSASLIFLIAVIIIGALMGAIVVRRRSVHLSKMQ